MQLLDPADDGAVRRVVAGGGTTGSLGRHHRARGGLDHADDADPVRRRGRVRAAPRPPEPGSTPHSARSAPPYGRDVRSSRGATAVRAEEVACRTQRSTATPPTGTACSASSTSGRPRSHRGGASSAHLAGPVAEAVGRRAPQRVGAPHHGQRRDGAAGTRVRRQGGRSATSTHGRVREYLAARADRAPGGPDALAPVPVGARRRERALDRHRRVVRRRPHVGGVGRPALAARSSTSRATSCGCSSRTLRRWPGGASPPPRPISGLRACSSSWSSTASSGPRRSASRPCSTRPR